jgi:hypothetical protein
LSLFQLSQTLLLEFVGLAAEKSVDRRLWMIFKGDIEKRGRRGGEMVVVEEKIEWINQLLKEMIEVKTH